MNLANTTPDARVDAFEIGFEGVSIGNGHLLDGLESHLAHIGTISTPRRERQEGHVQLTFDLESESTGEPAGPLRLNLHLRKSGTDIVFSNRCSIVGNGLPLMRGELGSDNCGGLSFDGKANVLGTMHHGPSLTLQQLPLLCQAVQYAHDAIDAAFPGWSPSALWIKGAEACRDLPIADSIAATRIAQHTTLCGTVMRKWDEYRRVGDEDDRGILTLRFLSHHVGPVDKLYPKSIDQARAETSCANRDDTRVLMGAMRGDFTTASIRELLLHFLTLANPRLDRLERHFRAALESEVSVSSLLIGLKALIDRASGQRKGKGPASPEGQELAVRAIDSFLATGMFDARSSKARHAIRRELDGMCGPDGPLERHPNWAIYFLKPQFARACAAIRQPAFNWRTI